MPARTKIEWADYSSNPLKYKVKGKAQPVNLCVPESPGCANCYAAAIEKRFHDVDYAKRTMDKAKPVLSEKELQHILNFKPKPPFKNGRDRAAVFIGDMTDLFGPWVPFDLIDRILAACALRPDVDWLFLTKHPELMRSYFEDALYDVERAVEKIWFNNDGRSVKFAWPLPHVWLGTSAESQSKADERIPELLRTPAAVRFVSAEPLLGLISLHKAGWNGHNFDPEFAVELDWVIVGGESGAGARTCDTHWIYDIVEQCKNASVPCFVKQMGSKVYGWSCADEGCTHPDCDLIRSDLSDPKGGDPSEWFKHLRVRQMPGSSLPRSEITPDSRIKR